RDYAFMIQSHLMFYDTSHNSRTTVLETLRAAFRQTALKMWAYMRSLHRTSRLRPGLVKMTIMRTVEASYLVLTSNFRKSMYRGYECSIRKSQVVRYVCPLADRIVVKSTSVMCKTNSPISSFQASI
ncbi:hypothetical protein G3M48_009476, partial [Beauveria asiatica]